MIVTMITDVNGVETVSTIESYYTNVGTTVIDIPEYVFAEDEDDDVRKTVTEDEWNLYVNEGNFAGIFYTLIEDEYSEYSFKSSGNAMEIDGKYIVFDSGKKYMLREQDGVWYASEWNEFDICATMIPAGLSFDDFVYSEGLEMYVQKEDTGTEIFYSIGFEDGVLTHILVQESLDPTDPGYLEIFGFDVTEIGGVEIDVPEYVIAE